MSFLNNLLSTIIAVLYNLTVHSVISNITKDLAYEDKINKSIISIVLSGLFAVILSKKLKKNKNNIINNGLLYGGVLLLLTPIVSLIPDLTFEMQLLILLIILGGIVWFYNRNDFEIDDKSTDNNTSLSDLALDEITLDEISLDDL